jgi:YidC/Oxa1 family membrane protein insertase
MDKRSLLFVVCLTAAFFCVHLWFDSPQNQPVVTNSSSVTLNESIPSPIIAFNDQGITPSQREEEFYVLENEYQQLVFSTRGGSLAEINLPLKSSNNKSIVREIDIDRQILKQSPENARFPLYPFYSFSERGKVLQKERALGGYYPLLRRALLNSNEEAKTPVPPEYYALNILDEEADIGQISYKVSRFEKNLIQFQANAGSRRITKTFSIPEEKNGPYCFQLDVQIDGDARGLWIGSGVPDVELVGGSYAPLLKYQISRSNGMDIETIDLPKKETEIVSNNQPNWISNNNGFLGVILDPLQKIGAGYKAKQIEGMNFPTRLSLIDPEYHLYPADRYPGYATYLPLKSGQISFRIFAGPYDDALLKKLDRLYEEPKNNYNPDYVAAQSIQGWFSFISQPFAKFLFILMQFFHLITRSWAASIILLTIALKVMMYPLNAWSIRSSLKMQEISPKVKALQEKYKKDPRKMQLEIMNLYKESKVNPFTGCIPVLLQMPFLIGMFYLLKSSFPLRGAPFIPGWIDDLASPDVLFSWNQPLWFIGNEFHLLPILMGITMFIQQKMTSKIPKDASQLNDAQKQQKMMGNMMSVLFTVMFYNFPSGLNIYFMFSTLLGVAQQWWMTKTTTK